MKRLFLGIPLQFSLAVELIQQLSTHDARLRQTKTRWLTLEQLHVTVHFFGDVDENQVPILQTELKHSLAEINTFVCELTQIANFPRKEADLIAVLVRLNNPLAELYAIVQKTIQTLNFPVEVRPYRPHITLCRLHHHSKIIIAPLMLNDVKLMATELVLFQSKPTAEGSEYIPLYRFHFK